MFCLECSTYSTFMCCVFVCAGTKRTWQQLKMKYRKCSSRSNFITSNCDVYSTQWTSFQWLSKEKVTFSAIPTLTVFNTVCLKATSKCIDTCLQICAFWMRKFDFHHSQQQKSRGPQGRRFTTTSHGGWGDGPQSLLSSSHTATTQDTGAHIQ